MEVEPVGIRAFHYLILLSRGALLLKAALPFNISTVAEWVVGPMVIWIGISSLRLAFKRNSLEIVAPVKAVRKCFPKDHLLQMM